MAGKQDFQYDASASLMSFGNDVTYDDPRFDLVLVQKKELPSERPIIDSTKWQRLSFYRVFASTTSKTAIIPSQQVELNSFLWFYALTVFFKTLPHSFVHFFLAAYAPEEHMFVVKMVPFCYGMKYLFVMVGFLELVSNADMLILLLHYCVAGVIDKNPWNRCSRRSYYDEFLNATINCYLVSEIPKKFINTTNTYHEFTLLSPDNEYFQVSTIDYYRQQIMRIAYKLDIPFFIIVWGSILFFHINARKRLFWKTLDVCQWVINIFDIFSYAYILSGIHQFDESIPMATIPTKVEDSSSSLWTTDLEMLAESITAPPVVHILTARSTQEIDPAQDSTAMVLSNAAMYIFRGLLSNRVKIFAEELIRTEIPITQFNHHTWFFLWPMFWQSFYLGDFLSMIYFIANFIVELFILVVIYQCLMESVLYEWVKLKRWMVVVTSSIGALLMYLFTTVDSRVVLWIYGKSIATLAETVFLYIAYPIGRLIDDFTFHYGVPPTRLRILSLRLVPIYYITKMYMMLVSLWGVLSTTPIGIEVSHYTWSWSLMLIPIVLGMLYIIYKHLIVYRMTWSYIFRPVPKWGPRDFSVRQLRKQFDSRFYISSEVPKLLSRYLTSKRESKVYKVDVRYDVQRRSTVSKAVGFSQSKDEKKIKVM